MKGKISKERIADLTLLFVAFIWASGFIVTKGIVDTINPIYFMFLRFSLATLLLTIIYFNRIRREINLDILKRGMIVGTFMFIGYLSQITGLKYTTVSNQGFIVASNVVMVPFIVWATTKHKPDKFEFLAGFLAFLGLAIISYEPGMNLNKGDLLSLVTSISFGFHIVALGVFAKEYDPIILTTIQFGAVMLYSTILMLLLDIPKIPMTPDMLKAIVYTTVVVTVIGFIGQSLAQRYTTGTKTAIILSLESIFSLFLAIALLKDPLTWRIIIGAITVFTAVIMAETKLSFLRKDKSWEY